MTTGALIFAFDNDNTCYTHMAAWCARRVKQYLGLPVALVTDQWPACHSEFDQVILHPARSGGVRWFADYHNQAAWFNASRADAYDLTPWDQTLLIDADYVINSEDLAQHLQADQDILAYAQAQDVTGSQDQINTFGNPPMPLWWATVMIFRRSQHSAVVFAMMQRIRDNWQHYRDLYHFDSTTYRNDYALSIALILAHGCNLSAPALPGILPTVMPDALLQPVDTHSWKVSWRDQQQQPRTLEFSGQDFHAMCKQQLELIIATN